jgi:biotin-dependent enzyme/HEAT repeat protein
MSSPVTPTVENRPPKKRMPMRTRLIVFVAAWGLLSLPYFFWRSSWFGRPLSNDEINEYLHDDARPRHIQHALVQIGERMSRAREHGQPPASAVQQWYPELVRLANYKVEEVRNTDAWLMGQDPSRPEFHRALLQMLSDPSMMVRGNAALSLVTFGDSAGHDEIVAMLKPVTIAAPSSGSVSAVANSGEPIHAGTIVATIHDEDRASHDLRAPITGKITSVAVQRGQQLQKGAPLAVINPGSDQVWEALRGLYFIGTKDDLPLVKSFESKGEELGDKIRQQAIETEKAILQKSESQK